MHPTSFLPSKEGRRIRYTLRVSRRARNLRLSVASGGVFTVTAPVWMGQSRIERFIFEKSEWVLDKIRYFSRFPRKAIATGRATKKARLLHFREHKERARALVQERLLYFNQFYGLKWNKIAIRNQRSRWGSCSRKKNLNFNYKIALLPAHLADYLVVHELCHLGELNHSQRFWDLVGKTIPQYRSLRRELRKTSM